MPEISVIIPVYNAEKYLRECLDSVLKQSFRDFECFCINDGSSDGSGSILDEYAEKDSRFRVFHRPNSGAGVSRNTALEQASGKYVICLDGDDLFEPELLEALYRRAEHEQAEVTVCRYDAFDTVSGAKTYELHYPENMPRSGIFSLKTRTDLTFGDFRPEPWKYLFLREFLTRWNIRFSTAVRNAEDVPFTNSALASADRIALVDRVLLHYRTGSATSLESGKSSSHRGDFFPSLLEWRKKMEDCGVLSLYRSRFCITAFYVCIYNLRKHFGAEDFASFYADVRDNMLPVLGIGPGSECEYSDEELAEKIRRIRNLSAEEYRNVILTEERELFERRKRQAEYAKLPGWRRCLAENGLRYTIKHILRKLTGGE